MSRGRTVSRGNGAAISLVIAALTVASCSGTPRPTVPPVAFGRPVNVAPAPAVSSGQRPYQRQLPVAIDGATAYIGAPDSVQVIDTQSPLITSAWRGKLYATNDGTSTDVYQAETHSIVHTSPGPPPMVVGDYVGVGLDANNTHIITRQSTAPGNQ